MTDVLTEPFGDGEESVAARECFRDMTSNRISLGPVFAYEWITSSRRWQSYAVRSGFVAALLLALSSPQDRRTSRRHRCGLAQMAEMFFVAVSGTQLAIVLLVRRRRPRVRSAWTGTRNAFAHAHDRSFGRRDCAGQAGGATGSGAGPTGCLLPVMELLTLLGGVDPGALLGGFVVSVGVAVLGCTLAMFFSLWVGKTHEALHGYVCGLGPVALGRADHRSGRDQAGLGHGPSTVRLADPFFLALAPYWWPNSVAVSDYFWFLVTARAFGHAGRCCGLAGAHGLPAREGAEAGARRPVERVGNIWRPIRGQFPG